MTLTTLWNHNSLTFSLKKTSKNHNLKKKTYQHSHNASRNIICVYQLHMFCMAFLYIHNQQHTNKSYRLYLKHINTDKNCEQWPTKGDKLHPLKTISLNYEVTLVFHSIQVYQCGTIIHRVVLFCSGL